MKQPKIKQYNLMRLISMVYKMFSGLAFIVTIVIVVWVLVDIKLGDHPDRDLAAVQINWFIEIMVIVASGGLLALTFAVFGQLIDLLLDLTDNMRVLADRQARAIPTQPLMPPIPPIHQTGTTPMNSDRDAYGR